MTAAWNMCLSLVEWLYVCIRGGPIRPLHRDPQWSIVITNERLEPVRWNMAKRYIINIATNWHKCVFRHKSSSCLYLKTLSRLFFKTQRFGDWILSPSSSKPHSVGPYLRKQGLALSIGPNWVGLPEDGDRIQFPKRCVFKNKQDGVFRFWIMSRNIMFVLVYHRHKLLDLK
jgi:hypothetical protein